MTSGTQFNEQSFTAIRFGRVSLRGAIQVFLTDARI
jgi:hypothetical protein